MAHNFEPDDNYRQGRIGGHLSDAEAACIVVQLDAAVTLKRRAGLARLVAHAEAVPMLSIQPSRLELSILMALVQTYGAAIVDEPRFIPVIDFVAERGALALVQQIMYGDANTNGAHALPLEASRPAFEFLCGTWPEVFMAQAHAALTRLGLPTLATPLSRS